MVFFFKKNNYVHYTGEVMQNERANQNEGDDAPVFTGSEAAVNMEYREEALQGIGNTIIVICIKSYL